MAARPSVAKAMEGEQNSAYRPGLKICENPRSCAGSRFIRQPVNLFNLADAAGAGEFLLHIRFVLPFIRIEL